MSSHFLSVLIKSFLYLNIFFTVLIIFFERKKTESTWAWIIVLNILPYFGFIIYLFFGLDGRKHKIFKLKSRHDDNFYENYIAIRQKQNIFFSLNEIPKDILAPVFENLNDMIYMNYKSGHSMLSLNNKIILLHDGESKFNELIQDINQAKSFIHLQYYVWHDDIIGKKIIEILARKAQEGIEVKLLIDSVGNIKNSKHFAEKLKRAGGEVIYFSPPYFFRINFRNHRKICIIDGKIGYIGGFNIGDEYIKSKRFGLWRDSHIRIYGDATKELELRFIMDWNFCESQKIIMSKKYFPELEKIDCTAMQIVSSGPDTQWPTIQHNYFKMINEANKYIYIHTPYFIPEESMLEALIIAALSGVEIKIIIPDRPDHVLVYHASFYYIGELLKYGIKFYKYQKGFIHSKLILIDDIVASVGTANMDIRSFKLNFEINAFIYDEDITHDFKKQFEKDLEDCVEISKENYEQRSLWDKIKESISRLFAPLL